MNSVVVKAAVFIGLLTTAVRAPDLGKSRFEIRASGGINAGGLPIGSSSPSYDLEAAFDISGFFALIGDLTPVVAMIHGFSMTWHSQVSSGSARAPEP